MEATLVNGAPARRRRLPQRQLQRQRQRGVTMLVVLVLMSVMLLGGLALSRLAEVSTLATGNVAYHEAALQASEIGLNAAYQAVRGLTDEETAVAGWYSPTAQSKDANGLPDVAWNAAQTITVGAMTVRYVVERACTASPLTDPLRECLVKQDPNPPPGSMVAGGEKLDPPNARQFRITVRVEGAKGTVTWVQGLVNRG